MRSKKELFLAEIHELIAGVDCSRKREMEPRGLIVMPPFHPLLVYLQEAKLQDLWPLINVCDQHDYIEEMVRYLHDTQNLKYVDMFIQKRSPMKTPAVVGALLDCDTGEDYVKNLIMSVGGMCPVEPLVEV